MIAKRSPHKFTRIGQAHTLFGAFKRRHGPKPAMVCVLVGAVVCVLGATAASQTPEKKTILPSPDVLVLADQMPNCKEFRNACQVCVGFPMEGSDVRTSACMQSERGLAVRGPSQSR